MKRIGIDARFYGSVGKGLGRYTAELISHLERIAPDGMEFVIFLRRLNYDEYRPANPRFRKVLADYSWYGFREQIGLPMLLRRHRLDLVHFPHFNVPILYRRPFVATVHDLILTRYPTPRNSTRSRFFYRIKYLVYKLVIASAVRRARRIIAVSDFTRRDLARRYPASADRIRVTYESGGDACIFVSAGEARTILDAAGLHRLTRGILKPYFLYVGNAYPHKNLEVFIDAAARFPEVPFVLVGKEDFFYQRLRQAAERAGAWNIVFPGFVDDRRLSVFYRYARAYVFPSLYEGFGLPPLEAMMYGAPVISSDRASLPEVLGNAVQYFDPEDTASLHRALGSALAGSDDPAQWRDKGFAQAAKYGWDIMAGATLDIYKGALGAGPPRASDTTNT